VLAFMAGFAVESVALADTGDRKICGVRRHLEDRQRYTRFTVFDNVDAA
jgi:hypothetical protein